MDVVHADTVPGNVDSGNEVKMTENTPVTLAVAQAETGTGNVDFGNQAKLTGNMLMTNTSEKIGAEAGPENVDFGNEAKMTENTPLTNTLEKIGGKAGPENVNSGNKEQMTENTPMTNTLEKTGGGVDSRLRRRSKYLSYPYTNGGLRHKDLPAETEESKTPRLSVKAKASRRNKNASNGSISSAKSGSKRFRSNWDRKFVSCSSMSSSPEFINASSGDLLSGLYSMAVDCMSPIENKNFDMVEWFFCKRRISEYREEAALATSLVNENGGKTEKPAGNDLVDSKSEKRKNTKTENAARRKIKPLSGLSDMKASTSTGDCTSSGKMLKQKRKVEDITSMHQLQNAETTINDSGNKCSSVPETPQNHNFFASAKMTGHKKKQKLEAAQVHQGVQSASRVDAKSNGCSSIVIDLPLNPPIPVDIHGKSNGQSKGGLVYKVSNPEIRVSQNKLDGNVTRSNLLASTAPEAGTASQEGRVGNITNHLVNAAPQEHPNTEHARAIPDLNNISFESGSRRKESETINFLSPELKSDNPRSLSACSSRTKTVNFDRVRGESPGTFLFLQFAPGPGVDIPSKHDLLKTFCRFGPLKASETQSVKDNGSAQIVFVRNTDAAEALRNLEQNNPFGATLVGYRLHHPPAVAAPSEQFRTPTQPTRPRRIPPEQLSLELIKLNLEMMASDLEKSGHTISPQKRAQLESEVKHLWQMVNAMEA